MSIEEPFPDRGVTLTKRGFIAVLCAQAEPFTVPQCVVRTPWGRCPEHAARRVCRKHREQMGAP